MLNENKNIVSAFYKKNWWNSWKYCIPTANGYRNILVDYWEKMKLNEDYKKGYNAAICDAIEYLKNEFIDVPENDNPHIESSKILNLEEFVWDFKRKLKKNINV